MIPPRFIVSATVTQMKQFISTPPAKNPLVAVFDQRVAAVKAVPDAKRDALRAQAEKIVSTQVYPAWKRGLALLQPLVGKANDDAGLWRFKGGAEAYAFTLRRYTTTNLTPDQIHEIGLRRVAEIEKQMDGVFRQIGRTGGSVKERMAQLKKEQAYPLTEEGRVQLIADANAILRDAESARPCSSSGRRKRRSRRGRFRASAKPTPPRTTRRRRPTARVRASCRCRCGPSA
jgi:uncharacterized protein (DUF885 family)